MKKIRFFSPATAAIAPERPADHPEATARQPEAKGGHPEATARRPMSTACHPETKGGRPEATASYPMPTAEAPRLEDHEFINQIHGRTRLKLWRILSLMSQSSRCNLAKATNIEAESCRMKFARFHIKTMSLARISPVLHFPAISLAFGV